MKKILYILAAVIVLLFILLLSIMLFSGSHQKAISSGTATSGFPTSSAVSNLTGTSATIPITATNGSTILAGDFLKDPATVSDPVNKGYYYLGYNTFNNQKNIPYMIEYIASTQYFNIELLQEPLVDTRKAAEQYLMQHLGISQQEMCNLNYTISVPDSVNSYYAGESLGFSFCPGAVALPN